ncbi:hypothetical protein D9M68_827080 [compost metagenome]
MARFVLSALNASAPASRRLQGIGKAVAFLRHVQGVPHASRIHLHQASRHHRCRHPRFVVARGRQHEAVVRLLIALIVALVTIFGSLFGLRRCEGSELPPDTLSAPVPNVIPM